MRVEHAIELGPLRVVAHELTVGEVRAWLLAQDIAVPVDAVHALVLEGCSLADIAMQTNVSAADLEGCTMSQLAHLVEICKKLNPHFFRVRAAILLAAQQTMNAEPQPSS